MDEARAQTLLEQERAHVQVLLEETSTAKEDDRAGANEAGDMSDPAESLTSEGADDAVAEELTLRLEALDRAEQRLRGRNLRALDT